MNTIGQMRWRLALVIAAVVSGLVVSTEATAAPLPWSPIASMPAPRGAAGATSLHDGLIYVVGGLNVSGAATSTLYVYDPATNRWSQKASAPVPLNKPNVVGSGGRLYVLGSRNRPRAAYRYDPVANIWSAFAAPPGGRTGFITGIGGSGRIYAIGGSLSGEAAYDPVSKTWSAEGSPLADKTVAVTNQYDQVDAISYDPVANTFALLPQSIAPIQDGSALSLGPDSRVYQLGGECVCDPSDMRLFSIAATQVFNPNTKLWGVAQFAPFDAIESATAVWGGKLYEFGGESTDSGSSSAIANAAAFTPGDVTPPTGTPPRPTSWGTGLINGAAPIVVSWPATDASGISWYDTSYRVNGGAWQFPGDFANQDSSHEFSIGYGQSYQWMAAATDNYGNRGLSVTGPAFTVRKYEESASLLRYTGVWHADTTSPLALIASGGRLLHAGAAGASVRLTFTGKAVAFAAPTSLDAGLGKVRVYVDGALRATVDENRDTSSGEDPDTGDTIDGSSILYGQTWTSAATHTIKLVVVGTPGRPRVNVDAFLVR